MVNSMFMCWPTNHCQEEKDCLNGNVLLVEHWIEIELVPLLKVLVTEAMARTLIHFDIRSRPFTCFTGCTRY